MTVIRDLEPQFHNHWRYWAGWGVEGRATGDGFALYRSGLPYTPLNGVAGDVSLETLTFEAASERLTGLPWSWSTNAMTPAGTHDGLLALGGKPSGTAAVMALDRTTFTPAAQPALPFRVSRVEELEVSLEWTTSWARSMGLSSSHDHRVLEVDRSRRYDGDHDLVRLVGTTIDKTVGTVELLLGPDWAGVYLVTTESAFRRRGVAGAMVSAAVRCAFDRGRTAVTLQANASGARVYEGLGFSTVSHVASVAFDGRSNEGEPDQTVLRPSR